MPEALPALIKVDDFAGEDFPARWKLCLEHLYLTFCITAAEAGLVFQGCAVRCRYHVAFDRKHASFWHAISEGPEEADRVPDLERCARIAWIGWVIRNSDDAGQVRWWENTRSSRKHGVTTHVVLWLFAHDYAVILQKRSDKTTGATFYLLVTSYCLRSDRKKQFQREWDTWCAARK